VDTLIVWVAQYLLWVMVAAIVAVWLFREDRAGRVELGCSAVLGLVLALAFMYLAKHVHHDPRPFVSDGAKALFGHSKDDGFPSDHSVAAGLISIVVFLRHRLVGFVLVLCGVAIGWARVAAHVHHLQDVVAGLLIGGLAAVIATVIIRLLLPHVPAARRDVPQRRATGSAQHRG
jgi:undecaprenyl-diphosphatase